MKVRPNDNYRLLGTLVRLDKNKIYEAVKATNQPDYKEKGKIFVVVDPLTSFLLEKGEYKVI